MSWLQRGTTITGLDPNAEFGTSLDVTPDGLTMIVGGPNYSGGEVRIFDWNNTSWVQRGITLTGNAAVPQAGVSVTVSDDGNTIAFGVTTGVVNDEVTVYEWDGSAWIPKGTTITRPNDEKFGQTLSLNSTGDLILIGSPENDLSALNGGNASVYRFNGTGWTVASGSSGASAGDMTGINLGFTGNDTSSPIPTGGPVLFLASLLAPHIVITQFDTPGGVTRSTLGVLSALQAGDSFGQSADMNANGTSIVIGARTFVNGVSPSAGRVVVYDWNGLAPGLGSAFVERGGVGISTFTGAFTGERLGEDVAMSDDGMTIAISSIQSYVRVLRWTGSTWIELIRIDGTVFNDEFGYQVSLANNGNTLFVTSPETGTNGRGSVRVYDMFPTTIEQVGSDIVGQFGIVGEIGNAVDISDDGQTIIIGIPNDAGGGKVDIRRWNGIGWGFQAQISSVGNTSMLGRAVALSGDGNTATYGVRDDGGVSSVEIREFVGSWNPKGTSIQVPATAIEFGSSLALNQNGTVITIGAPFDPPTNSGRVVTYEFDGITTWNIRNVETTGTANSYLGSSVAMTDDGNTRAYGAVGEFGILLSQVYVETWNGANWLIKGAAIPGGIGGDDFGRSIALSQDGNTIIIGAPLWDPTITSDSGRVLVFDYDGFSWIQRGSEMIGDPGYMLGFSVDINADGSIISSGAFGINTVFYREWNGTEWALIDAISGTTGSEFGFSNRMNRSGNRVIIGAPQATAGNGVVRVYDFTRELTNQDVLRYVSANNLVKIARVGDQLYRITNKISTYAASYTTLFSSLSLSPDDARDLYDRTVFPSNVSQYGGDVTGLIGQILTDVSNNDPGITVFATAKNQWSLVAEVDDNVVDGLGTQGVATSDMRVVVVLGQSGSAYAARTFLYDQTTQSYLESAGGSIILNTDYNIGNFQNVDISSTSADTEMRMVLSFINSGTFGEVNVYQFNYGTGIWDQFMPSIPPIGIPNTPGFGFVVAMSGDGNTIAVGTGPGGTSVDFSAAPQVMAFRFNGLTWVQLDNFILATAVPLTSGYGLSLNYDGTVMVIGNPKYNGDVGSFITRFLPSTGVNGGPRVIGNTVGFGPSNGFGRFVSLSEDGLRVLVGSSISVAANAAGTVAVFEYDGAVWNLVHSLIDGERGGMINNFGRISGDGKRIFLSSTSTSFSGITAGDTDGIVVYEDNGSAWIKLANVVFPNPTSTGGLPTYIPFPSYTGKRLLIPARVQELSVAGFDVFTLGNEPEAIPNFYNVNFIPGEVIGNFITDSGYAVDTALTNAALSVNNINGMSFASYPNTAEPGYAKEVGVNGVATLFVNSNGSFLFRRTSPSFMEETVTYDVSQGALISNTTTITFTQLASIPVLSTPTAIDVITNLNSTVFSVTNNISLLVTTGGVPLLTYTIVGVTPIGNTSTLVDPNGTGTLVLDGLLGSYTFTPDPTRATSTTSMITLQVEDSLNNTDTAILTINYTVNPDLTMPAIADTMINSVIGGTFIPNPTPFVSIAKSGGTDPTSISVLPLSGTYGDISFTSTQAQYLPRTTGLQPLPIIPGMYTDSFVFQVTDNIGDTATTMYNIQITVVPAVSLTAPPVGTIFRNQNSTLAIENDTSGTLSASNGRTPYLFSITGGNLSSGVYTSFGMYGILTVNQTSGAYSYTLIPPTASGPYTDTFMIEVVDDGTTTDFQMLMIMITINNDLILPPIPTATISSAINSVLPPIITNGNGTLAATGGTAPITYRFGSGPMIPGPGANEIDQVQTEARIRLNTVNGSYSVIPETLPTTVGTTTLGFPLGTIDATGDTDTPGITVNVVIVAELILNAVQSAQILKAVNDTIPPITSNLSGTLVSSNGVNPIRYDIDGASIPGPGANEIQQMKLSGTLRLNTVTGAYSYILGTLPNMQGTFDDDFTVKVIDNQGNEKNRLFRARTIVGPEFRINMPGNGSVIKQIGNPNLTLIDLNGSLTSSGGKAPISYAINGSSFGTYGILTLTGNTGAYSYNPLAIPNVVTSDTDIFTVEARDSDGRVVTTTLTINITVTQGIFLMPPSTGIFIKSVNGTNTTTENLSGTLMQVGGGPPIRYGILSGSSIVTSIIGTNGILNIDPNTGVYNYTPLVIPNEETRFSDSFTFTLEDGVGARSSAPYRVDFSINPQLLVNRPDPSRGSITRNITQTGFTAVGLQGTFIPSGGLPPYTFQIQGGIDNGSLSELTKTLGKLQINKTTGFYQFTDPVIPGIPGEYTDTYVIVVTDKNGESQNLDYVVQIRVRSISLDLLPVFTDVQNRSSIRYWNFVIHTDITTQLTQFFENTEILVIGQTDSNPSPERNVDDILRQLLLAAIETSDIGTGGEDVIINIRNDTKDVLETENRAGALTYSLRFRRRITTTQEIERIIELSDILSTSHKNFLLNRYRSNVGEGLVVFYYDDAPQTVIDQILTQVEILSRLGVGGVILVQVATRVNLDPAGIRVEDKAYANELGAKQSQLISRLINIRTIDQILSCSIRYDILRNRYQNVGVKTVVESGEQRYPEQLEYSISTNPIIQTQTLFDAISSLPQFIRDSAFSPENLRIVITRVDTVLNQAQGTVLYSRLNPSSTSDTFISSRPLPPTQTTSRILRANLSFPEVAENQPQQVVISQVIGSMANPGNLRPGDVLYNSSYTFAQPSEVTLLISTVTGVDIQNAVGKPIYLQIDDGVRFPNNPVFTGIITSIDQSYDSNTLLPRGATNSIVFGLDYQIKVQLSTAPGQLDTLSAAPLEIYNKFPRLGFVTIYFGRDRGTTVGFGPYARGSVLELNR